MITAQEYLNKKYPTKEKRERVTVLIIDKKGLEGHLDLSDFVNLEELDCCISLLTSLDLSKNYKLKIIIICLNNISANLNIFSHLINLEKLCIGY